MSTDTDTERDEMHALALRTATRIEEQAAAVRLLEEHAGETWSDLDLPEREAVLAARRALEFPEPPTVKGGLTLDLSIDAADGLEDWREEMQCSGALSISRRGTNHGDGWVTDEVVIVLGTGGPHVEVQYRGGAAVVVAFGWFGAGRVELPVDADAVDLLYGVDYLYQDEDA